MSEWDYEKFDKDIQKMVHIAKRMYKNFNSRREKGRSTDPSIQTEHSVDSIIVL